MAERPSPEAGGNAIAVEVLDHAVAIRPSGEIDIETAPALRFALAQALAHASPAKPVTVDCSDITFCGSSALNALLAARLTAQETGTVVRLAAPQPPAPAPPGDDRRPAPLPRGPRPAARRPLLEGIPGRAASVGRPVVHGHRPERRLQAVPDPAGLLRDDHTASSRPRPLSGLRLPCVVGSRSPASRSQPRSRP
ncbi:STAS domain-containing protein [Streptomyces nojiriensis]|uniref:STAS domain-containing protein n=1 Tax=Streptomyces nojiriensis TaxID=66374 RepID=UPI0035DB3AF8